MTLRVVVTDSDLGHDPLEADVLGDDFSVVYAQVRSPNEIVEVAQEADGLLVQWATIDKTVLSALPRLRAIVRFGVGLDNIDCETAALHGVEVANVPDYCIDEVASHASALIESRSRRIAEYNSSVKSGGWNAESASPRAPDEDPVGIAGFGRIGRSVGSRLSALGYPIHVYDPLYSGTDTGLTVHSSLLDLAKHVNHLTLHLPASRETDGCCDFEVFAALGPEGHLVNTARGSLVVEPQLIAALDQGELGWASLDVLRQEPPEAGDAATLARHPRVTCTPHAAYLSRTSKTRLRELAAQRLKSLLITTK